MTTTDGSVGGGSRADSMGFSEGQLVEELGWDSDADEDLREAIMDAIDADLVEESDEAVDAVLLWWRDTDGDLADGLVDALTDLSAGGTVWLLTPKVGRAGHVEPSDIADSATTAGLAVTKAPAVSAAWHASRLVRPKGARK